MPALFLFYCAVEELQSQTRTTTTHTTTGRSSLLLFQYLLGTSRGKCIERLRTHMW
jgi:hypothetical protein